MDSVTAAASRQFLPRPFVLTSAYRPAGRRPCSAIGAGLIGAVLIAAFLWLWPSHAQGAVSGDAAHQAAQSVLSNDAYQRELPFPNQTRGDPPSRHMPSPSYRVQLPEGVGAIAEVLLWTILAAGAVLVVFWLVQEFSGRLRERDEASADDDVSVVADRSDVTAAATLDEADRLAEQGAYAEAMHLLLLHTLDVMRRKLGMDFRQSLTSREILARREISADARTPLSMIVSAVELTYFGGRSAGAGDYRDCRLNFERFAAAGSGPA